VRQLLAFSRQQVLRRTDVDVNLLTAHLLAMLERMIGEHITLVFQDDPGVGLVHADPSQLEQALVNLCLNAREAMPEGGRLEITTADVQLAAAECEQIVGTSPGRHVRLTVTDTGHGMPPEVAAQACEPFFTTKGVGEGSGLGLPSVYGIIQQHGGGLTVRSQPGQGTSVDLYLPVRETTTAVRESPAADDELAGEETILVAEDDPGVRQLTCQLLANSGYQVLTARDGHEALAVFAQHAAELDLALLDVVMPGGGGREVHDAIRRTAPDLPILFCTGYDLDVVHPGFTPGAATAVLQKPFGGRELLRQVRTLLPPAAP
jgi:CheY-like chemotaxis protein